MILLPCSSWLEFQIVSGSNWHCTPMKTLQNLPHWETLCVLSAVRSIRVGWKVKNTGSSSLSINRHNGLLRKYVLHEQLGWMADKPEASHRSPLCSQRKDDFFKCQSYSAAPYWGLAVLFCLNFGVVFDRKYLHLCNRSSSLTEQEPRICSEWHARVRRFGCLTSGCPHTEYHHTWQAWQQALLHHWPLQVKHFMWKWLVWTRSTSPLQGCPHLKHWMIRFPTWGWQPSWVWRTEGKEIPWFTKLSFLVVRKRKKRNGGDFLYNSTWIYWY